MPHALAHSRTRSRLVTALLVALAMLAAMVLVAPPAHAATPDYGIKAKAYSGVSNAPTSDKPQSKLWYNDGAWWSTQWKTSTGWRIYKLDRSTETWVDAGVTVDTRGTTLTDTLWDGSHLYIASQVATVSTPDAPVVSKTGQPAKLYRYTYTGGVYKLDTGFPVNINNTSSESLTIDKDSTGRIWATWTQVSGSASAGYKATVYVNASAVGGASWGTPLIVPTTDPNPTVDDISAVVAFKGKIGVMWSDESAGKVFFATHPDTSAVSSGWTTLTARSGTDSSDDHLNLKSLQSDSAGRVFAVLKTSLDISGTSTSPQIVLVTYTPATNAFATVTVSTVADCQTRAQVVINSTTNTLEVYSAGPSTSVSGCPHSGTPGAIYRKTTSLSSPSFVSGRGTPVIQDGASANVNNPTTTKQSVTAASGTVVLASNHTTKTYWFYDSLQGAAAAQPAPVAGFTATPSTGTAPLAVAFADTSTNTPTSWSWTFGDGGTAATQNPSHTYTAPGTYTATLTATNATGSDSSSKPITVTAPAPSAPVAGFTATPTSGTAPLDVAFADTSTNTPTSWAWDFGDGGTSTSQNPSHTYTAAGTYSAKLTATNAGGSNSSTQTITVTAPAADAPVAGFTATPTTGTAPLVVAFSDTTTNTPTSWAWDFGDGGTSTSQNPSHTYTAAGTYSAKLTATNAGGSDTASRTITVTAGGGSTGAISVGASTTDTSLDAATAVGLTAPSGMANGDVLIAQINADTKPSMATVPSGWTQVITPQSVSTYSTLFVYRHTVTDATSEPSTYEFGLSVASKWNGGVSVFGGVDTTNPIDVTPTTKVNTTSTSSIAVPSVTTATAGALLIGGVGMNSATIKVTPPSGWTERWEADGAQNTDLATKATTTAGATGTVTSTLSGSGGAAAWLTALRPAS